MAVDKLTVGKPVARRLRVARQPERPHIQGRRFRMTQARREVGRDGAIAVPGLRRRRIEIGPRIGDPVLAVDGQLDRELVVMRMSAPPVLADGPATDREIKTPGPQYGKAKRRHRLLSKARPQ